MRLLDTSQAILPKENADAKGGTITRQIVKSGFSIDDRPLSNADIESLYYNTKKHFLEKGIMVKVKIGHYQEYKEDKDSQKLMGFITSMSLYEDDVESGSGKSIWADLFLYQEVYSDYKEGRYPEASIGAYSGITIKDSEGNDITDVIEHVALLGSQRAAIPDLERKTLFAVVSNLFKKIKTITKLNTTKSEKEVPSMDIEKFKKLWDSMYSLCEEINMMVQGDGSEEPPAESESPPEDAPKEEPPENKSIDIAEATKLFSKLVANGNLLHSDRKAFDSLLKQTNDFAFVETFYGSQKAKAIPSTSQKTKSNRDESHIEKDRQSAREMCIKMGIDPDADKETLSEILKSIREVE